MEIKAAQLQPGDQVLFSHTGALSGCACPARLITKVEPEKLTYRFLTSRKPDVGSYHFCPTAPSYRIFVVVDDQPA